MYCSKCGTEIGNDHQYCMKCGTKVDRDDTVELTVQPETAEDDGVEWDGSGLFCAKCGAEAAETDAVCRFCECPIIPKRITDETDAAEDNPSESALSDDDTRIEAAITDIFSWKWLIRLGLMLVLIFFCFPFTMVSCSGEDLEVSGVELMAASLDAEIGEEYPSNVYVIIAFGAGVAALIASFMVKQGNKSMLGVSVCSAGAALFLMIFRATFMQYYQLEEYSHYIQVEFLWGWYLCLFAYLALAATAFYVQSQDNKSLERKTAEEKCV